MLNPKSFGLAGGIVHGGLIFVLTLLAMLGIGKSIVSLLGGLFVGYTISIVGSIVGLVYGAIIGFIIFYLIAYMYNMLETK